MVTRPAWVLTALVVGSYVAVASCSSAREEQAASVGAASRSTAADAEPAAAALQAPVETARGRDLYARHCAICHGDTGAGDGQAAYLLSPAPRDFTQSRFRLVSTQNGVPTEDDLVATLGRGMPGSAMPSWDWMPPCDRRAVAQHVRVLAVRGMTESLLARAAADDEEMSRDEALEIAISRMTPGPAVAIPPERTHDAVALQEGRRFFLKICAPCHDVDGTGRSVQFQWNEDGTPAQPRDFTAGIFKASPSYEDICRRMLIGLPGSPMPATRFDSPEQTAAVAAFVQSLVKPGAQERVLQKRQTIRVPRVGGELPTAPGDAKWKAAQPIWLPLMPLWWHEPRIEGVVLRAYHDGQQLALRLSWVDASKDDEMLGQDTFGDAAALQWSVEADPPLLTMGEKGRPVNIWQWKAAWELDLAGARDITARYPNIPPDIWGHTDGPSQPLYLTGNAAGNPLSVPARKTAGEALSAEGFGTLTVLEGAHAELAATGEWVDGLWDVVFVRPLSACCPGEVAMQPGKPVFFGTAVWDGSARDRDGQKSITVWHRLELE